MNEKPAVLESTSKASLARVLENLPALGAIRRYLDSAEAAPFSIGKVSGSSGALLATALWNATGQNLLILTRDQNAMYRWLDDLQFFAEALRLGPPEDILPLPHPEVLPYETKEPDPAVEGERLGTLRDLIFPSPKKPKLVVAPVRSVLRRFPPLKFWKQQSWDLRVKTSFEREVLLLWLSEEGYEYRELVCGPGEYSARGGIVDIYPRHSSFPIRVELFGDEIDSLRIFDLVTQRSTARLDRFSLLPGNEDRLAHVARERDIDLPCLLEELSGKYLVALDEPDEMQTEAERFWSLVHKMYREMDKVHAALEEEEKPAYPPMPPEERYLNEETLHRILDRRQCLIFTAFEAPPEAPGAVNLDAAPVTLPSGPHKVKLARLAEMAREGQRLWVICDNEGQQHRLEELLRGDSVPPEALEAIDVQVGGLHSGFALPSAGWVWITDREIFGRYRRIRQRFAKIGAMPIVDLVDLKPGDYVVHEEHGIARYKGLKRLAIESRQGEFLELEYADSDTLYVPIDQIHRIGRYIGSSAAPPKLNKLGGRSWQNTKNKARQAIEDMAGELLELYAERSVRTGHSFPSDTPWQHEFEASFLFDETPDQLRSIGEVKKDMESPKPMDRLICGDVGFGKTEVALRAAFKAVMSGKQVAVLVPTTVLADQHYRTFAERLADYPVAVEALSRFRSPADQKETVRKLAEGGVDIIIGTHRLLQKDVRFRDLGLVVIDEEQRFGVRHKERLKQMRTMVDCLTLTATPIPRTLYMSLNGVRDMSLVNTPPKDRLPIQTYVYDWSHEVIESAILREMARGGQVYFVHNRVQSIGGIAELIHKLVPEARVAVGHGQMEEKQLSKVMRAFVDREYDVLLSTTIIESGIDIPNVNTIIINRADAFGLAELYQLRGRVGRDRHRAYCYLLVPSKGALTRVAKQRLLAIQEFNQLGSGFQLALRDMEIRGMGNLLGKQQHGHIAAIGFDLYGRLLAETIEELTGKKRDVYPEPELDFSPEVARGRGEIPADYVPSARLRMSLYKRVASLHSQPEVDEFEKEIADLYGPPPPATMRLIESQRIWILAWEAGIDLVRVGRDKAVLRYCEEAARRHFAPEQVIELDREVKGQLSVSIQQGVVLTLRPRKGQSFEPETMMEQVRKLLVRIREWAGVPSPSGRG